MVFEISRLGLIAFWNRILDSKCRLANSLTLTGLMEFKYVG